MARDLPGAAAMLDARETIDALLADPRKCDDGVLVNNLLRAFHRGYPVEELHSLLHAQNVKVVSVGIWLASELAQKAAVLRRDVTALLKYPATYVRYYAIDCLLTSASADDEHELATVVDMLDDADVTIRIQVMNFLTRCSQGQLKGACRYFERTHPESEKLVGLRWLIGDGSQHSEEIRRRLRDTNSVFRKYAAVAAARMAQATPEPLALAASCDDDDIARFAAWLCGRPESETGIEPAED